MKILGLDLGTASIGWSVIEISDSNPDELRLQGLGSRIIQYENNEASDFSAGKGETPCAGRTVRRTARKGMDRYQQRREQLRLYLIEKGLMQKDEKFPPLDPLATWKLRSDASTPGVRLAKSELARVLLHLNQRRGYRHAKSDMGDAKQTEYVSRVNDRFAIIRNLGQTIGQFFYTKLKESETTSARGKKYYTYRIKEEVFPRDAYAEEFDVIMDAQKGFYPELLTPETAADLKNIIFFQRPLKSCKHLVSYCDFEKRVFRNSEGKDVDSGPKVTPKSSPLEQVCRIYEAINNLRLVNSRLKCKENSPMPTIFDNLGAASKDARKLRPEYAINDEERLRIFNHLNTNERLSEKNLLELLGLKKSDGFKSDRALAKGIPGNKTYCSIAKALEGCPDKEGLLRFNLKISEKVDEKTGELTPVIDLAYLEEPLYRLWHTLYSIKDKKELFICLRDKFGINDNDTLERLYAIDFVKDGYANKSAKFIRRLLPHLMRGEGYSEACRLCDVNHSNSITKEENEARELKPRLDRLNKGELRQPLVEKIINQTINVANAVADRFGKIDEVRIELARELKQSKEDRAETSARIGKLERENQQLASEIAEMNITPTRRRIQKMRMLRETGNKCIYCGKVVTPYQFIEGHGYEIEHIIPRSRIFDDSFSNKVCSCRECNSSKGALTGYDFMKTKSEQEFNEYLERIENLFKGGKISKSKRDKLRMSASEIPSDFIERDLRESQYIAKKAREILSQMFRNVYASSGSVTSFFRHVWGYDDVLHNLNLPKYREAELVEEVEYTTHDQKHKALRIKDWSKRKDHRHHAIDALVIALTRQGYIQRLNTLNALSEKDGADKMNLEKWAALQPHFSVAEVQKAVDDISVSFKAGKKLATPGKRYVKRNGKRVCVQEGIIVPRGPLTKDYVYGKIRVNDGKKDLKYLLKNSETIADLSIRKSVEDVLKEANGSVSAAMKRLKKNPLVVNGLTVTEAECFHEEVVIKYNVDSIKKQSDINSIVDADIRRKFQERFDETGEEDFVKSLAERPIYSDAEGKCRIRTVRCFTGIKMASIACVKKDADGKEIGFSQTQNNHHLAFYRKADGKVVESVVSFWDGILRKRYGMPVVVKNPVEVWQQLANMDETPDIQSIAAKLPPYDSEFLMSLQRNEMLVLGMSDDEWNDAVAARDHAFINEHLYRVWKLSPHNYCFKFHTDTTAKTDEGDKKMKMYYIIGSIGAFYSLNPHKVVVNLLGDIDFDKI